jgi:hypothetical protein
MSPLAHFSLFLSVGAGDNRGVFSMCDYSLHNVKSRPAKIGDKLTTRKFNTVAVEPDRGVEDRPQAETGFDP